MRTDSLLGGGGGGGHCGRTDDGFILSAVFFFFSAVKRRYLASYPDLNNTGLMCGYRGPHRDSDGDLSK